MSDDVLNVSAVGVYDVRCYITHTHTHTHRECETCAVYVNNSRSILSVQLQSLPLRGVLCFRVRALAQYNHLLQRRRRCIHTHTHAINTHHILYSKHTNFTLTPSSSSDRRCECAMGFCLPRANNDTDDNVDDCYPSRRRAKCSLCDRPTDGYGPTVCVCYYYLCLCCVAKLRARANTHKFAVASASSSQWV